MPVLYFFIGLVAGAVILLLIMNVRISRIRQLGDEKFIAADRALGISNDRLQQMNIQLQSFMEQLNSERSVSGKLNASLAEQKTLNENFREKLETQKKEIAELHQKFILEFENLSSKILEEKSQKFTEQNRSNLDIILSPLKEKIKEFEQKVDQTYKVESAERNTLKGEIKNLIELNRQISEEANNLTRALKGDTKKQGNWGEVILTRILERSGLERGSEYELQLNTVNEEGQRIQPDVVIYLPENKHIIIDSKVSLVAYENLVNCKTEDDREQYIKEHLISVRNHIRILAEKNYYSSQELNTPDFVLIFMPIEPSFSLAVQSDAELFNYAWDRKIVLVSPSTLLATLKTINAIWKHEKQTKNALEIARVGGALYDKFVNFLKDMENVSDKIMSAQKSHADAMHKLATGGGNILKKVEELKKLGAKTNKDLPQGYLEKAEENDAGNNY